MTARVKAVLEYPSKKRCILHIYVQRVKGKFNMGNSSFLLNHDQYSIVNPKLIFQRKKYSTGDYKKIEMVSIFQNKVIALQLRCTGDGKLVSLNYEKILSVEFELVSKNIDLSWRMQDTAVVDNHYLAVDTVFKIEK